MPATPRLALAAVLAALPLLAAAPAHAQYEAARAEVETFVAPTGGPVTLTGVSMGTFSFFTPTVAGIYAWNGTDLSGPNLARVVLPPRFVPGISLTFDLALTPGATYAFALFPTGTVSYTLAPGGLVQAGQAYQCSATTGCASYQTLSSDPSAGPRHYADFAVTFATPTTTPEPAPLVLSAAGLAATALIARRRRTARA